MSENLHGYCEHCVNIGDIVACNKTPCEFRNSWYIRFLKEKCCAASQSIRTTLISMDSNVDYPHLTPSELAIIYNLKKGAVENWKSTEESSDAHVTDIMKAEHELKLIETLFDLDGFITLDENGFAQTTTEK